MRRPRRDQGFTLIETAVSLGILGVLLASIFSIVVESSSFLGDVDADVAVQIDGNRAFTRVGDILRKSGRMDDAGVMYPRVVDGGSALEFRVGRDLDGNGYAFNETDGSLEWDARIFTLRASEDGDLGVFESGVLVYPIARHIFDLSFETIAENNTLHLDEVSLSFDARKELRYGGDAVFAVSGSVHMRN